MNAVALILAGGASPKLSVLTDVRTEAAIPFGGKYRIIDFVLSNCVNSDIYNVAVLTQYRPRSLNEHIGAGRPWDLDRTTGGIHLLQPYLKRPGEAIRWQKGTADAVRFHLDFLEEQKEDLVLILGGDHVYKMDYRALLQFHVDTRADVTIAVHSVPHYEAYRYGIVVTDEEGQITHFQEKPKRPESTLASMGIYVFNRSFLVDWLSGPGKRQKDFGREVIPALVEAGKRLFAYPFFGYWTDIGTVQAYWEANMGLLGEIPPLNMDDPEWVIHTRSEERPPVLLGENAVIEGSLLCDGAQVEGTVIRSVISPGVRIAPGAVVRDSVVLTDAEIRAGAVLDKVIVDKEAVIGEEARVGMDDEQNAANRELPTVLNTGLTLIGKKARVPAGAVLGRNVVVRPYTSERRFHSKEVPSGSTIGVRP
ncbi:MAG: glucose-1-phosphate adenylyltransferase [Chloroflexi bacterium]|nr:glucose-1-phosphate adenylyltransferase [Chloroflexota bacterium]